MLLFYLILKECNERMSLVAQSVCKTDTGRIKPSEAGSIPALSANMKEVIMKTFRDMIKISDEVLYALTSSKPIVALESTIITHGMPFPENIQTAKEVEEIVRQNGVVPATIAVIKGIIHIGLTDADFNYLAESKDFFKANSSDLPVVLAKGLDASTTVSASIMIAHLSGIKFFVTGGIGGVHRNAESSFDISTDLKELSCTPLTVVCSGPKAILDIPKTIEYIETHGITLLSYQSEFLPAFYSSQSPYKVNHSVSTPNEIAEVIVNRELLRLKNSVLVANPVPSEHSIEFNEMELLVKSAISIADNKGIKGKELTPFLLNFIKENTGSKSLNTNIALIKNNADLGAKTAKEYFNFI